MVAAWVIFLVGFFHSIMFPTVFALAFGNCRNSGFERVTTRRNCGREFSLRAPMKRFGQLEDWSVPLCFWRRIQRVM